MEKKLYSILKIGILTIGEDIDDEKKFKKSVEQSVYDEEETEEGAGEEKITTWERTRLVNRRLQEVQSSGSMRRGLSRSPATTHTTRPRSTE